MRKKNIPPEDSELFRRSIGKVEPVNTDKLPLITGKKPKPYPARPAPDFEARIDSSVAPGNAELSQEDLVSYTAAGLQQNVLRKMRQGLFGLDAEIDLHGLTSREARQQLLRFLYFCVEDGCRCVHIIHGKGYRSPDNRPILKNELNKWLRQHKDVQAFCSASPRDGGTGAVYVLLRLADKYRGQKNPPI